MCVYMTPFAKRDYFEPIFFGISKVVMILNCLFSAVKTGKFIWAFNYPIPYCHINATPSSVLRSCFSVVRPFPSLSFFTRPVTTPSFPNLWRIVVFSNTIFTSIIKTCCLGLITKKLCNWESPVAIRMVILNERAW